ncbi:acyltransferase family protein [Sphingomonas taxi]|uniref:acyltransferase family protein n=1 Tax=Sphingomonas taxi TaxID=1549858 RepID=UPI0009DDEB8A|nr:acyltransferase [Sphingomonas taxi]
MPGGQKPGAAMIRVGGEGETGRRNQAIDSLRGLLVLAVIVGHYYELSDRHGFLAWLGAGVRMPLFIGLAGYLFNLESARTRPLTSTLRKYGQRLIIPWAVACAVYLTSATQLTPLSLLTVPLRPPFHFWFVPVMMTFILIAALSRRSPLAMLGVAIPISIAAMYMLGVQHVIQQGYAAWLPDRRFFIYPIYFFYGLWVAQRRQDRTKLYAALALAPIGLLWWCTLYVHPSIPGEVAASLITSLSLICLLPGIRSASLVLPLIGGIGRQSLFFYLWHPMVFALWSSSGVIGMSMLLLSIATLFAGCALLARSDAASRVFGITRRRHRPPVEAMAFEPIPLRERNA